MLKSNTACSHRVTHRLSGKREAQDRDVRSVEAKRKIITPRLMIGQLARIERHGFLRRRWLRGPRVSTSM